MIKKTDTRSHYDEKKINANIDEYIVKSGYSKEANIHKLRYLGETEQKLQTKACHSSNLLHFRDYDDVLYDECKGIDGDDLEPHFDLYENSYFHSTAYNFCIFDFSKYQLKVDKKKKQMDLPENIGKLEEIPWKIHGKHRDMLEGLNAYLKITDEQLMHYTVNIESLFKNGHFPSFFHANTCFCDWCERRVKTETELNADFYKNYSHIDCVYVSAIKTKGNRVRVWTWYNGISAM